MLHAHIETESVDCDGPVTRNYILTMTDKESADTFGDIDFHKRVAAEMVTSYGLFQAGRLLVTKTEHFVTLEWFEEAEEGVRHRVATICDDDCDLLETVYQDHRAEEAGY